jgi:fructokinase
VNLRLMLWESEAEARNGILEGLKRAAVVKLSGAQGSIAITERGEQAVPSVPVKVADTTGAGDGFVAGLLSGLADHSEILDDDNALAELCRFANAVGAMTTTGRGAIPSLPTKCQINALLSGN